MSASPTTPSPWPARVVVTVSGAIFFWLATSAFDVWTDDASWSSSLKGNAVPALIWGVLMAVSFAVWPTWQERRRTKP